MMTKSRAVTVARAIAVGAAVFATVIGLWLGTYSAADTDPYGYVSQAELIAAGTLRIELQPATFPVIAGNDAAWAPAGYVLSRDGRSVVPMYPPGLPAIMAALQHVTGARAAVFYVVPFVAALAVLATYWLGVAVDNHESGAIAAVLLATNPVVLLHSLQPVSDVPATAWWIAALTLVLRGAPWLSLPAGLLASLAVLTRPHLVPLAAVIAMFLAAKGWTGEDDAGRAGNRRRLAWFLAGSVPGALAVAAVNQSLHGSPLLSGYGALRDLFRWEHVLPNLDRYPRWLLQTTPFAYLAGLAPFIRRDRLNPGVLPLSAMWIAVVFLLTIFYGYFGRDEWGSVRFLLPALPLLLILGAAVVRRMAAAVPWPSHGRATLVIALTAVLTVWQLSEARRLRVFEIREVERRYADVGTFVATALPGTAVLIAGLHSGSIRYYANRPTVYYPRLRQGSLDLAIRTLQERGRDVYLVLEDGERAAFSARFATSAFARLDWPPTQRTTAGVPVSIWNVREREPSPPGLR
jgi:4-amino-4-deoxy-L-arabinose transferase-like glycosyltransferase